MCWYVGSISRREYLPSVLPCDTLRLPAWTKRGQMLSKCPGVYICPLLVQHHLLKVQTVTLNDFPILQSDNDKISVWTESNICSSMPIGANTWSFLESNTHTLPVIHCTTSKTHWRYVNQQLTSEQVNRTISYQGESVVGNSRIIMISNRDSQEKVIKQRSLLSIF